MIESELTVGPRLVGGLGPHRLKSASIDQPARRSELGLHQAPPLKRRHGSLPYPFVCPYSHVQEGANLCCRGSNSHEGSVLPLLRYNKQNPIRTPVLVMSSSTSPVICVLRAIPFLLEPATILLLCLDPCLEFERPRKLLVWPHTRLW